MVKSCILVDDERQALNALKYELQAHSGTIKIIDTASSVNDAIAKINLHEPDVIFLDIRLNDGLGFDVLRSINQDKHQVVFTSAYSEYALKAFEYHAVDYLLKPIDSEDLKRAILRMYNRELLTSSISPKQMFDIKSKKISIATGDGISVYRLKDITHIKADRNYSEIHSTSGKVMLSAKTLKEYQNLLEPYGFFRTHHSYMVNAAHITSYLNKDGGYIELENQTKVPVSKRKKAEIIEILMSFNG